MGDISALTDTSPLDLVALASAITKLPLPAAIAKAASESSKPARTGFFSIPLEIRLQIYAHLLQLPDYHPHSPSDGQSSQQAYASILRTCRLVNYEATHLLYAGNAFIAHPSLLASFPRLRPHLAPVSQPWPLACIRRFHLTLRLDNDPPFTAAAATEAFSGVDELTIYLAQSSFLAAGCANLRLFEGVRGVGRVRIEGSTTGFEEYVEWLEGVMRSGAGCDAGKFVAHGPSLVELLAVRFNV